MKFSSRKECDGLLQGLRDLWGGWRALELKFPLNLSLKQVDRLTTGDLQPPWRLSGHKHCSTTENLTLLDKNQNFLPSNDIQMNPNAPPGPSQNSFDSRPDRITSFNSQNRLPPLTPRQSDFLILPLRFAIFLVGRTQSKASFHFISCCRKKIVKFVCNLIPEEVWWNERKKKEAKEQQRVTGRPLAGK